MKAIVLISTLVTASFAVELDLDALEHELMNSPLVEIDDGLSQPRLSLTSLFRKSCYCNKITCGCCVNPDVYGSRINGCFKFTPVPEKKQINIVVTAWSQPIVNMSISTSETGKYCGTLPGEADFLSFCLNTLTEGNEKRGVTICTELEVIVRGITAVSVDLRCIKLKDGKISFSEHKMPSRNGILNLKARAGFKKVVDLIKEPKN